MDRTLLETSGHKKGTSFLQVSEKHFVIKTTIILFSIMMMCFLFSGCQRGKEPGQKKEINVQTEKIEQPIPLKTKPDFQSKQGEKQLIPPKVKELVEEKKKEKNVKIGKVGLTEEEQREFRNWRDEWDGRTLTEEKAHKYLSILVRGSNTVKWYSDRKLWGTGIFENDICKFVDFLASSKSKEGYKLVAKILENPDEWVSNLKCVLGSMKSFGMKESVPLLRKYLDYKLPRDNFPEHEKSTKDLEMSIKFEAAGSLLALGDADTALPVLDELAKEGATSALGFIFHNMQGKEWEQRGIALIKKALTYENKESRALAALFLIGLTQRGVIKEDTKKLEDILIKIAEDILDKKTWPISSYGYSDHRALETIIMAFGELESKKAIPVLRRISEHPDASYLKRRAEEGIKYLSK